MFMVTWWKCKKFDLFGTIIQIAGKGGIQILQVSQSSDLFSERIQACSAPDWKKLVLPPRSTNKLNLLRSKKKRIITLLRLLDQCCQWWSRRSSARQGTVRCCSWCTSWSARAAPGRSREGSKSRRRRRHRPPASTCRSPPSGAPARSPPSRPV